MELRLLIADDRLLRLLIKGPFLRWHLILLKVLSWRVGRIGDRRRIWWQPTLLGQALRLRVMVPLAVVA